MPQAMITIEQIGSPIRRPCVQRKTLKGLGLNRIGRVAELQDTPEIRGMIAKVSHLVRVVYATPDGRKIDFVVDRGKDNLYIEVKTVRPKTKATKGVLKKFEERKKHHPPDVEFVIDPRRMGGAIYGDAFASRAHFLEYTQAFEERLAAAKAIRPGPGILVFCGNGFAWRRSNLEDWSDFYHLGAHRADDPFGPMERHHIKKNDIELKRNVDHFAWLQRPFEQARRTGLTFPIRGPDFGR